MLILSRRVGENLVIDGDIKVVVLECTRNSVRLGIEAPSDITIWRGELVQPVVNETSDGSSAPAP
jgi:carbon storage regulator